MSSPLTGRLLPWIRAEKSAGTEKAERRDAALPQPQASSDEELLQALSFEDEATIAELFDRFGRLVFGIAWRIVRDRGEAEEIVQDVFLQLIANSDRFDPCKSSARAWITRVAVHKAIDRRAFLSRRRFYEDSDIQGYEDALRGPGDIEAEILQKSLITELRKALEELPSKQRITLEWAFFEGCSLHEISARLGDTYINVRHYFYRGLEKVRKSPFVTRLKGE